MLGGKIGKAFEPSLHHPAKSLGKQRRQDREEHYADDRGEHRGATCGAGGKGFLTLLIAETRCQLIDSHFKRKLTVKVRVNVDVKVAVND